MKAIFPIISAACACFLLAGCVTSAVDSPRTFSPTPPRATLSLDECISIALTNNFEVRKSELSTELARLGKKSAFSAFLPRVTASAGFYDYEKQPRISSQQFREASFDIGLPLFMPSTWFLYAASKHGYEQAGVAAEYVRRGIVLKTSAAYCDVLTQQELIGALRVQLEAAKAREKRAAGLAREGFVQPWESAQAELLATQRASELRAAERKLTELQNTLLICMGLSPRLNADAPQLALDAPAKFEEIAETTEELVLWALENHPQIKASEFAIELRNDAVKTAFCEFIPVVNLFVSLDYSTDEVRNPAEFNWLRGASLSWSVFKGLANIANYKASKVEREKARLAHESLLLDVVANIVSARNALENAAEAREVRERAWQVAQSKAEDFEARAREGLIPENEALDARADADFAQVNLIGSRFQEYLAAAALRFAVGR